MNIRHLYVVFSRLFRPKRMRQFWRRFVLTPGTRVLDVGRTWYNWSLLPDRPRLVLLNVLPPEEKVGGVACVVADGRCMPFKDGAFDIVYSNSVIEHLGSLEDQRRFASECMRVGLQYYVQTPNQWFPVEPHLITPLIHWLPRTMQRRLLRNFTVWGWFKRPTTEQCEAFLQKIRLLNEQMDTWGERGDWDGGDLYAFCGLIIIDY